VIGKDLLALERERKSRGFSEFGFTLSSNTAKIAYYKTSSMKKDKRHKRDLHGLNKDGMVLCNVRDKEAAHRAQTEGIATENWKAVTCPKCLPLIYKFEKTAKKKSSGK
jgi:hypothetical protein